MVAGAQFAKWRATIKVQAGGPSDAAIVRNAEDLASYAAITQVGAVPPERRWSLFLQLRICSS